jgi:hypothetical protein
MMLTHQKIRVCPDPFSDAEDCLMQAQKATEDLNSSRDFLRTGDLAMGELKTIAAKIESDVLHIPEELRDLLGHDTRLIVGTAAVVAFSAGTSYADVLRSLKLIQEDVQFRMSKEKSQGQDR